MCVYKEDVVCVCVCVCMCVCVCEREREREKEHSVGKDQDLKNNCHSADPSYSDSGHMTARPLTPSADKETDGQYSH